MSTSHRSNVVLLLMIVFMFPLQVLQGSDTSAPGPPMAQLSAAKSTISLEPSADLADFQVLELRRYVIKDGERNHFAQFFDTFFPEAFQQTGAIVAGSFIERGNSIFTWIRGCHTIEDRGVSSAQFYYGSVWKEHRKAANDFIVNADNDMLLRPLTPERGIPILPVIDPVSDENTVRGVVVAEIFTLKPDSIEAFAKAAEPIFAHYRSAGAREAGVLVTLEGTNTFPQLTIRTDGPFLVWLGLLKDNEVLERDFRPLAERSLQTLSATGLLRQAPELVVMDPTRRSRLRWLP